MNDIQDLLAVLRELGSFGLLALIVVWGLRDLRLQRQQFLDALKEVTETLQDCLQELRK